MTQATIETFFDEATFTASYVVHDPSTGRAAIIDPVLDYDAASGRTSTKCADRILDYLSDRQLDVDWILETHVHADHMTAAVYLKEKTGGQIGIGDRVGEVQNAFAGVFNAGDDFATDGRQFDRLFADTAEFKVGSIDARVMHAPGHTPACVVYVVADAAFVGDTLFMPDYGTARCDFPGGDARTLYRSIQKILTLPDDARVFTCHDYKAPGRDAFAFEASVKEQRDKNVHIAGVSEDAFVAMREERDAKLSMPKLILPAVQVNMRAGQLPPPDANGINYLKIPVNAL